MRLRQRAYFAVSSQTMTAAEITARLGIEPDGLTVRGSKRTSPTIVPLEHSWSLECREPGLRLNEQVTRVLGRLEPVRDKLREPAVQESIATSLHFVRTFSDASGEEDQFDAAISKDGKLVEKMPGQHQLLGWALDLRHLEFLVDVGAFIDADEYG